MYGICKITIPDYRSYYELQHIYFLNPHIGNNLIWKRSHTLNPIVYKIYLLATCVQGGVNAE